MDIKHNTEEQVALLVSQTKAKVAEADKTSFLWYGEGASWLGMDIKNASSLVAIEVGEAWLEPHELVVSVETAYITDGWFTHPDFEEEEED